ncbi:MAG TPA: hypothetical protein VFK48_03250 [Usitatibacter sp.]|nr:hypothetical protein [Usitatibacter sp.]
MSRDRAARVALLAAALLALVTGAAGGLSRLGAGWSLPVAAATHGALMVAGFLGTVISLERAVALGGRWALSAPIASALGTVLVLFGWPTAGALLWLAAPVLLLAVSIAIVKRQAELHTVLLALAAVAWLAGNALHSFGGAAGAPAWWFTFLVLTIAAERLEMTRLMKRRRGATPALLALIALLVAGAAGSGVAFGAALSGIAAWLALFDLARRTVRGEGFARYAAVALLGGYAWLAAGGVAWALMASGHGGLRDAAMHAVGLGFVLSMILAHAPIVVPVIARLRMRYVPFFYVPLALLHLSLLLRLGAGFGDAALRLWGGALNAAAIVLFAATVAGSLSIPGRPSADVAK